MTPRRRGPIGSTLLELVVALAILGIASTVVLVAWRASEPESRADLGGLAQALADARRRAIASGRPQVLQLRLVLDGSATVVSDQLRRGVVARLVAYPDGGVVADSNLPVERLSGTILPALRVP